MISFVNDSIHEMIDSKSELLHIAIRAALDAGREILKSYAQGIEVEFKSDLSPLTIADQRSNDIINTTLASTGIPIISEENKVVPYSLRSKWENYWLIDPLDGTKEFIKRNGEFTVNIALMEDNIPTMGVVYAPAKELLYYGSDAGAFKIEKISSYNQLHTQPKIQLKAKNATSEIVVVASRSHLSLETEQFINHITNLKDITRVETLEVGSSMKICMVAEGKADIYPRFAPTMEWDIAAGHAICRAIQIPILEYNRDTEITYNKEDLHNPWFIVGNRFGSAFN